MDGKTHSVEKPRISVVERLFGNGKMLPNETCKKADRHTEHETAVRRSSTPIANHISQNNNWTLDTENSGNGSKNEIASDGDEENEDLNNGNPLVTENDLKEKPFVLKGITNVPDAVNRGQDSGQESFHAHHIPRAENDVIFYNSLSIAKTMGSSLQLDYPYTLLDVHRACSYACMYQFMIHCHGILHLYTHLARLVVNVSLMIRTSEAYTRTDNATELLKRTVPSKMLREKIWLPPNQLQYHATYTIYPAFAPMMSIVDRLAKKEKVHPKESMRYEMMRFLTLRSYPAEGKPSVLKFAKAGFYYASNKDEVICYCCAKRISNWKPDDDPYQAHKRITPNCSFIVNNGEVNVPVSSDTGSYSNDVLQKIITDLDNNNNVWRFDLENSGGESENEIATDGDEEYEDQNNGNSLNDTAFGPKRNCNVIDTVNRGKDSGYASLPIETTNTSGSLDEDCFRPEPQGGFASMAPISENRRINQTFQTGVALPLKELECRIANINTTAYQPTQEDIPRKRNSNRRPRTRTRRQRQQSSTPSVMPETEARKQRSNETLVSYMQASVSTRTARNRIGHHAQIPKHPKYSTISSRIASFNQCPEIHVMPRTLAEAGFYYAGIGDCTRCFWCGIGLRHWTREDDPWTEHARFSLDCNHVLINKGQEFINLVKLALDLTEEKDECPQAQASEAPAENQETERPKDDVENLMTSDAAQSVRDMGYNDDIIRIAIHEIITSKGKEKLNGMNIMEEIFRIEDEPVNNKTDSTEASSTVQTITTRLTEACAPAQKNENTTDGNKSRQEQATSIQTYESKGASADVEKKTVEHRQKRRLMNENKALKESTMCSTCRKSEVCIVFLPCGHLISCEQCGNSVRTCMTCGQRVRGTVRTYRA